MAEGMTIYERLKSQEPGSREGGQATSPQSTTGVDLDLLYGAPERQRVLIIDDEPDTVFLLKEILRGAGFDVIGAMNFNEALKKVADIPPDIILLDLMMPEVDGWETYKYLRQMTKVPVIVVSAKASKEEVVDGLQRGVDDYVTKPFYNAEVVARVRAVLRRADTGEQVRRLFFPAVQLVINLDTKQVSIQNRMIHLTSREFSILVILARHAPSIVNYETIAKEVWGEDTPNARKRIKYLIYLLRRKLEDDPDHPRLILNIEGVGYQLQTEVH
jgi:DNA-binding response OmpR family regulator